MNELLFIASPAIRALGFALVHSIWQALLIAVVAAIFLKKTGAADGRYRLGIVALLAVFASAAATFFYYLEMGNGSSGTAAGLKILQLNGNSLAVEPGIALPFSEPSFFEKMVGWFEANHAFIVGTWLIGAVFFLVKLLGGYWFANRMKTRQVRPVLADFDEILTDLLKKLPNPRPVKLLESTLAAVPMTLGWLRPAILLPIGLVNHLTIEEVEFVLAHELAHIVRRDWIFNLAQAFIEALFYFNPAVWWLSARIREERENVADDLALHITGGPAIGYAKALVRVQEAAIGQFQPALALAFSSKKRPNLLGRVQRIIFQQPQSNNASMEKMIATGLILALAAALSLRANPAKPVVESLAELATGPVGFFQNAIESRDSIAPKPPVKVKGDGFVSFTDGGKSVRIKYKDGEVRSLNINGEEIPEADFGKHDKFIAQALANIPPPPAPVGIGDIPDPMPAPAPFRTPEPAAFPMPKPMPPPPIGFSANWDFRSEADARRHEQIVDRQMEAERREMTRQREIDRRIERHDARASEKDAHAAEREALFAERDAQTAERDAQTAERDARTADQDSWTADRDSWTADRDSRAAKLDAMRFAELGGLNFPMGPIGSTNTFAQSWGGENPAVFVHSNGGNGWLRELLANDGFDQKKFTVKLNEKVLKINGKKQSAEMHGKYLETYQRFGGGQPGSTFEISVSEKSTTTSTTTD